MCVQTSVLGQTGVLLCVSLYPGVFVWATIYAIISPCLSPAKYHFSQEDGAACCQRAGEPHHLGKQVRQGQVIRQLHTSEHAPHLRDPRAWHKEMATADTTLQNIRPCQTFTLLNHLTLNTWIAMCIELLLWFSSKMH